MTRLFSFISNKFILLVLVLVIFASFILPAPAVSATNSNTRQTAPLSLVAQTTPSQPTPPDPTNPTDTGGAIDQALTDEISQEQDPNLRCESSIGGLGWLLCEFFRLVFNIFDWLINNVLGDKLLKVDLTDDKPALQTAWRGFLTISNLVLIAVFMLIIYGQTIGTSMLEGYTAAKMLPRLVVAVIMSQLSFVFVELLIEIFNDLGTGIGTLVLAPVQGFEQFEINGIFSQFVTADSFFGIKVASLTADSIFLAGVTLAGGIAAAVGVYALFELGFMFAIVGLFILFALLIMRKILIISMLVLAPIAFVLNILPSTQKAFAMWWETLFKSLLVYPIIMFFVASGALVGKLVIAGDNTSFLDSIISMFAVFLPLFFVAGAFKLAGSAMTVISGTLGKLGQSVKGDARNPTSARSILKNRAANRYSNAMLGRNPHFNVPEPVTKRYARMRWVDLNAAKQSSLDDARKRMDAWLPVWGPDFMNAAAVTGGGRLKGVSVGATDDKGNVRKRHSEWLKTDKFFARNEDGSILSQDGRAVMANNAGVPLLEDDGGYKFAKTGDFYNATMMSTVRAKASTEADLSAASEHAIKRSSDPSTHMRILNGLNATPFSTNQKSSMFAGVAFAAGTAGSSYVKNLDYKFDQRVPTNAAVDPIKLAQNTSVKIDDLLKDSSDSEVGGNMKAIQGWNSTNWNKLSATVASQEVITPEQKIKLDDLAMKAANMVNRIGQARQQSSYDSQSDDDDAVVDPSRNVGSSAVSYAQPSQVAGIAEQAIRNFLHVYHEKPGLGTVKKPDDIDQKILPPT